MATGTVGNLKVGLGLDYAAYSRGLLTAQAQAETFSRQVKASFLGNLGAGLTQSFLRGLAQVPGAFVDVIRSSINAADHLNDLSKKTGVAVETLGGIGFAAQQAGGDLESATAATGKLNKSLAEAAAGNKEASEAFKVLGISVKDATGNTISADNAITQIADKFASYADGPEKAALALRIFGKAGAEMIPLLDEGGRSLQTQIAYFKRYSGVTAETAKAADEFNDTLTKIKLLSGAFAQQLTAELLPTLQAVATAFLDAKEKGDGFAGIAGTLGRVFAGLVIAGAYVIDTFGGVGREIGAIAAQLNALAHFDLKGFTAISDEVKADGVRAKKELETFVNNVLNPTLAGAGKVGAIAGPKPAAPRLAASASGPKDDPARKQLENELKALEANIDAERQLFQNRNRFIELFNSQNLVSVQDYYSARDVAQRRATQTEMDLLDSEILALEAYKSKKATTQTDREGAEGKIIDLRKRRARIEQDADADAIERDIRRRQSLEELEKAFSGVSAQVLDLRENFAAAAAVKFDLQFDALSKTFTANGNAAGLEAIATLRAATIAQAAFQKASLDASRTLDALAVTEERIAIAQQTGALTSLDGLIKLGAERKKQIPILEAQVAAEEAIAKAAQSAGTAGADDLARKADASRLALEKLKAASDPLAESLNKSFGDEALSAIDGWVQGVNGAGKAFEAFGKGVLNTILKMGEKSIVESIFGGSGGAGGLLSSFFGSGSGASTGGIVSGLASLFSGFFADGGTIPRGQFGIVGENGPELAFGGSNGQTITPASQVGGTTNHINVQVQATPGMNRATALQQGADIGEGIQRSLARNR